MRLLTYLITHVLAYLGVDEGGRQLVDIRDARRRLGRVYAVRIQRTAYTQCTCTCSVYAVLYVHAAHVQRMRRCMAGWTSPGSVRRPPRSSRGVRGTARGAGAQGEPSLATPRAPVRAFLLSCCASSAAVLCSPRWPCVVTLARSCVTEPSSSGPAPPSAPAPPTPPRTPPAHAPPARVYTVAAVWHHGCRLRRVLNMVSRRVVRMVRMVRMVVWVAPCLRLEACHLVLRCVARLVRLVRGLDGARL
eukprot:scaffold127693_cov75-Phaeocystis_antarctica.AAC.1